MMALFGNKWPLFVGFYYLFCFSDSEKGVNAVY